MPFRRNQRGASPHRKKNWTWSGRGWPRQNAIIEKGRIDMTKKKTAPGSITASSGNVFADLGLPNPEQQLMKAELTLQIYRIIKQLGMTQAEAAKALGIKQPH